MFPGAKVIAAKLPLEHFVADLRVHQGRLALTPSFHLVAARYTPRCRSTPRPLHYRAR